MDMKHSEIEFRFIRPLNPEEEDIFISYFSTMQHKVMDRLLAIIKGTDKNPLRALAGKLAKLGGMPIDDQIMARYLKIYNDLQAQKANPGPDDIFVLDKNDKDPRIYVFRMDMEVFDMSILGNSGVPVIQRELFNLARNKDKQIGIHVQRVVFPVMKFKPADCRITTKLYDEQKKEEQNAT
jgi:hypothetical protein